MKPRNVAIELDETEIKAILQEWAQREYPGVSGATVTLSTHEYGDCMDRHIGWYVSASVRLNSTKED